MDRFPVLLRLKPLCFAQEVLEQPALFSADALLELGESFLHRARLVELFRLAKFDAVNQRELDHALEMDLWELFPHDQSRRKSSLSLRDPSGRPGPPENPFSQRPRSTTFLLFLPFKGPARSSHLLILRWVLLLSANSVAW